MTRVETFGALLKRLRVGAGLSQNRLARMAAIDPAYVNRLERSVTPDHPPSRAVVLRLWSALGTPPEDRERLLVAAGHCPELLLRMTAARFEALLLLVGSPE